MLADVEVAPGPGRGRVVRDGLVIRRSLPQPYPTKPWLYCVSATMEKGLGFPDFGDGGEVTFTKQRGIRGDGFADVRCAFRNLTFAANITDALADAAAHKELTRFITRTAKPSAEATKTGGLAFKWVPKAGTNETSRNVGNEAPAKVLPIAEVRYTLHMWPRIPSSLMGFSGAARCTLGRINASPWDPESLFGEAFPAGTLLYLGCDPGMPYYTASGTKVWDIDLVFSFRPDGWINNYRQSVHGFREVSSDGVTHGLDEEGSHAYEAVDFMDFLALP